MLPDALARYRPRTAAEAADLDRVRSALAAGDPWDRRTALHLTASALIVHPPTGRVLLRWHARQQAWLQVGGHADPGETDPLAVALREGREETGLDDLVPWPDNGPDRAPDGGIVHLAVVPVAPRGDEPAHEHADIRFILATGRPEAARPENPGARLRWLSLVEARQATAVANLQDTLDRVEHLLRAAQQPIRAAPTATSSNQSVSEPSP